MIRVFVHSEEDQEGSLYQVNINEPVSRFVDIIKRDHGEKPVYNMDNYGLLLLDNEPKLSIWLDESRNFSFYNIADESHFLFRSKIRVVTVKTLADHIKKIKIDESRVVGDQIALICEKFGICDYEEYSLICEDDEGTMNSISSRKYLDKKDFDKLRHKVHTEDELNWLIHSKTFRQQDIPEKAVLTLRRKYFFSDQNVSDRDPIQLQLLYIQIKEAVVNDEHPITVDQAIRLAALQCQIERGPSSKNDPKNMSINLHSHLPVEYTKKRGIEKKIKELYKQLDNMKEITAKVEYIKLCRSFPTYGISFFLVKEKLRNRNRFIPILFGISKESVYRVDVKSKEIIEKWPLTQISQWVPGANTFVLSFGGYRNDYIIATSEGYRISQMLSGYIDIIMKKTKKQDPIQNQVETESTIFEDCIEPQSGSIIVLGGSKHAEMAVYNGQNVNSNRHATFVDYSPGKGRIPDQGHMIHESEIIQRGAIAPRRIDSLSSSGDKPTIIDLKERNRPIRALVQIINSGLKTIEEIGEDLDESLSDYEDIYAEKGLPYKDITYDDQGQISLSDPAMRDWITREFDQTIFKCNTHLSGISHGTVDIISKSRNCLAREYESIGANNYGEGIPQIEDVTDISVSLISIKMNMPSLFSQVKRINNCDKKFNSILNSKWATDESDHSSLSDTVSLKDAAKGLAHALRNLMEAADVRKRLSKEDETSSIDVDLDRDLRDMFTPDKIKNSPQYYIELIKAAMQVGDASKGLFHTISKKGSEDFMLNSIDGVSTPSHENMLKSLTIIAEEKNKLNGTFVDIIREIDNLKMMVNAQNIIDEIKIHEMKHLNTTIEEILHFNKVFEMEVNCIVSQVESCYFYIQHPGFQKSINNSIGNLQDSLNCIAKMENRLTEHTASLNRNRLKFLQDFDDRVITILREEVDFLNGNLNNLRNEVYKFSLRGNLNQSIMSIVELLPDENSSGQLLMKQGKYMIASVDRIISQFPMIDESNQLFVGLDEQKTILQNTIKQMEESPETIEDVEWKKYLITSMTDLINKVQGSDQPITLACVIDQLELSSRLTSLSATQLILTSQEIGQRQIYDGLKGSEMIFNNNEWTKELVELETRLLPYVANECILAKRNKPTMVQLHSLYKASCILSSSIERLIGLSEDVTPLIKDEGSSQNFEYCIESSRDCATDLRKYIAFAKALLKSNSKDDSKISTNSNKHQQIRERLARRIEQNNAKLLATLKEDVASQKSNKDLNRIHGNIAELIDGFGRKYLDSKGFGLIEQSTEESVEKLPELAFILMREFGELDEKFKKTKIKESSLEFTDDIYDDLYDIILSVKQLSLQYESVSENNSKSDFLKIMKYSESGYMADTESPETEQRGLSNEMVTSLIKSSEEINSNLLAIASVCISSIRNILLRSIDYPLTYDSEFIDQTGKTIKEIEDLSMNIRALSGYLPGNNAIQRLKAVNREFSGILSEIKVIPGSITSSEVRSEFEENSKRLEAISNDVSNLASKRCKVFEEVEENGQDETELMSYIKATSQLTRAISNFKSLAMSAGEKELRYCQKLPIIIEQLNGSLFSAMRHVDDKKRQETALDLYNKSQSLHQWCIQFNQSLNQATPVPRIQRSINASNQTSVHEKASTISAEVAEVKEEESLKQTSFLDENVSQIVKNLSLHSGGEGDQKYVTMPLSNDNYIECWEKVNNLSKDIMNNIEEITKISDEKEKFKVVKEIAKNTIEVIDSSKQSAYLKSVAHETSNPGSSAKLSEKQWEEIDSNKTIIDNISRSLQSMQNLPKEKLRDDSNRLLEAVDRVCEITVSCLFDLKQTDRRNVNKRLEIVREIRSDVRDAIGQMSAEDNLTLDREMTKLVGEKIFDQKKSVMDLVGAIDAITAPVHSKISERSLVDQKPLLDLTDGLSDKIKSLLKSSIQPIDEKNDEFNKNREEVQNSLVQLKKNIGENVPGISSTESLDKSLQFLMKELDSSLIGAMMDQKLNKETNLDEDIVMLSKVCQNINMQTRKIRLNFNQSRLEFLSHELKDLNQIMIRFVQICQSSVKKIKRIEHREQFIQSSKTIVESVCSMNSSIGDSIKRMKKSTDIDSHYDQINMATSEFCTFLDQIGSSEGGTNSCIAIIKAACERLEDYIPRLELNPGVDFNSDENLQIIHSKLISQNLTVQSSVAEVKENFDSPKSPSSKDTDEPKGPAKLALEFSKLCDTVQTICYHQVISSLNPQRNHNEVSKARKLRHASINFGQHCISLLRAQKNTYEDVIMAQEHLSEIIKDFYPVLQVCMISLNRLRKLVEAIDLVSTCVNEGSFIPISEVISKAYSGCSDESNKSINYQSILNNQASIASLKATALESSRDIIKNIAELPETQDDLFVWTKMCHVKMAKLAEAIFLLTNKMYRASTDVQQDKCSQLCLLSKTKDLALSIIQMLEITKSGIDTKNENSSLHKKIVEIISANGKLIEEIQRLNSPLKTNRKSTIIDSNQQTVEFISEIQEFLNEKIKVFDKVETDPIRTLDLYCGKNINFSQENCTKIQTSLTSVQMILNDLGKKMNSKDRQISQLNESIFMLKNILTDIFENALHFFSANIQASPYMVDEMTKDFHELIQALIKMFISIREIFSQSVTSQHQMPDVSAPIKLALRSYKFSSNNISNNLQKYSLPYEL